jgi:hypothetical protein
MRDVLVVYKQIELQFDEEGKILPSEWMKSLVQYAPVDQSCHFKNATLVSWHY